MAPRSGTAALVLRHLRDQGGRSRATLAAETGLSKATISTVVGDLAARGLVHEGGPARDGAVGRPGLTIRLDGRQVCGIGIEVNVDYLSLVAVDLAGAVIRESTRPVDAAHSAASEVVARIGELLHEALASLRAADVQPVGVTIAAPGFTDSGTGRVRLAPNLGWRDVPLADEVTALMGPLGPPVRVEHDAALGAVAERAFRTQADGMPVRGGHPGARAEAALHDLLYITGDVGVGGGIIAAGQLLRGARGLAGEIGHLPLDPARRACACGRRGCWETMVGLAPFLRLAADEGDPVRDPWRPLEDRLRELRRRATEGDERTVAALDVVAEGLGTGVSILVDVLDPDLVVLGGYFAWFEEQLVAPVAALLVQRRLDPSVAGCPVVGSRLGLTSAARGGAHLSLEAVFEDPSVVAP